MNNKNLTTNDGYSEKTNGPLNSFYASILGRYYKNGGQFDRKFNLPEDSFKQGGNHLHDSIYSSSLEQYPGIYAKGGHMNFKSNAAYKAWLGYGHASGAFERTPGNQAVSIQGHPHSVQHAMGGFLGNPYINSYDGGGDLGAAVPNPRTMSSMTVPERTALIYQAVSQYINQAKADGRLGPNDNLNIEGVVAQILLETGNGTSSLVKRANNFGGIKADDKWKGPKTGEYRLYSTPEEGLKAQIDFYIDNARYRKNGVFEATTPEEHLAAVKRAGYATAPNYVSAGMSMVKSIKPRLAKVDMSKFNIPASALTNEPTAIVEAPPITEEEIKQGVEPINRLGIRPLQPLNISPDINTAPEIVPYTTGASAQNQMPDLSSEAPSIPKGWFGGNNVLFGGNKQKKFAEGGPMNQLTEFNEGGSHEENPLGGIPQGMNQNGGMNLVQEGETKNNAQNFIYSDDITISKSIAKQFNINSRFVGKTYADASKKANRTDSRRETDTIEQNAIAKDLDKLAQAQEAQKQEELQKDMAKMAEKHPEFMAQMMQTQQQPQVPMGQPSPEEMAMMQQQGQMDPAMMQMPQGMTYGGPMSYKCGGNMYNFGGSMYAKGGPIKEYAPGNTVVPQDSDNFQFPSSTLGGYNVRGLMSPAQIEDEWNRPSNVTSEVYIGGEKRKLPAGFSSAYPSPYLGGASAERWGENPLNNNSSTEHRTGPSLREEFPLHYQKHLNNAYGFDQPWVNQLSNAKFHKYGGNMYDFGGFMQENNDAFTQAGTGALKGAGKGAMIGANPLLMTATGGLSAPIGAVVGGLAGGISGGIKGHKQDEAEYQAKIDAANRERLTGIQTEIPQEASNNSAMALGQAALQGGQNMMGVFMPNSQKRNGGYMHNAGPMGQPLTNLYALGGPMPPDNAPNGTPFVLKDRNSWMDDYGLTIPHGFDLNLPISELPVWKDAIQRGDLLPNPSYKNVGDFVTARETWMRAPDATLGPDMLIHPPTTAGPGKTVATTPIKTAELGQHYYTNPNTGQVVKDYDPATGQMVPRAIPSQTFDNIQYAQSADMIANDPKILAKNAATTAEKNQNIELLKTMTEEQKAAMRTAGQTPIKFLGLDKTIVPSVQQRMGGNLYSKRFDIGGPIGSNNKGVVLAPDGSILTGTGDLYNWNTNSTPTLENPQTSYNNILRQEETIKEEEKKKNQFSDFKTEQDAMKDKFSMNETLGQFVGSNLGTAYNLYQGIFGKKAKVPSSKDMFTPVNPYRMNINPQLRAAEETYAGAARGLMNVAPSGGAYLTNRAMLAASEAATRAGIMAQAENAYGASKMQTDMFNSQGKSQAKLKEFELKSAIDAAKQNYLQAGLQGINEATNAQKANQAALIYANMHGGGEYMAEANPYLQQLAMEYQKRREAKKATGK